MDIWTALRIIGRNWSVVVPALLMTLIVAVVVPGGVKPTYKTSAQVIFLAPSVGYNSDGTPSERNPYSVGSGAEAGLASTVVGVTRTDTFAEAAAAAGAVPTYEIGVAGGSPIIGISVEAITPAAALKTQGILIDMVAAQLTRLQESAGAPPPTWITSSVLDSARSPVPQLGRKNKVLVAVSLIGIALSCTLGFVAESLRARSRRHSPGAPPRHIPVPGTRSAGRSLGVETDQSLPPGRVGAARRTAIEAVAWSPPPDALPFRLQSDADPRDEEDTAASPEVELFRLGDDDARDTVSDGNGNGTAIAEPHPQNGVSPQPPKLPSPPVHR